MTPEYIIVIAFSLLLSIGGLAWAWHQASKPSRESRDIALLRMQLADEMERNDKLATRSDRLSARVDALESELEVMREEREADREEMRAEMNELLRGIEQLIDQLQSADLTPVWRPSDRNATKHSRKPAGATLATRIEDGFTIEEIDGLAFDIGIERGDFGGETVEVRARELVSLARRRNLFKRLEKRVKELRS